MERMFEMKLTFAFDASNDKNAYDANKLQGNFSFSINSLCYMGS